MKLSTSSKILAFAKQHPDGFFAQDVRDMARRRQAVYVALSNLKKKELLTRDATGRYKLNQNDQAVAAPPKPEKPKLDPARKSDVETISWLVDQNVDLNNEVQSLKEQRDDALTIIRYLEDKLIRTIQYTAQFEAKEDDA
jgi:hypothetical protein